MAGSFPSRFMLITLALLVSIIAYGDAQLSPQTRDTGALVGDNVNSLRAGPTGATLLQDVHHLEKLFNFDRERIPERVVHAIGSGAHGVFESSRDISDITTMSIFQKPGTKTDVFVRFSLVTPSKGGPETTRDPRGFSTKFYTEEGNWDLVGNNIPVFFIRDSISFPDLVHASKPDPRTNLPDPNRAFDFFSMRSESTNMLTYLFSDLGVPASYRKMDGNGIHAYKFINSKNGITYVKFNWKSMQGIANLTGSQISETQANTTRHLTEDLTESIQQGEFPSWELRAQLLKPSEFDMFDFNPLDATKVWPGVPFITLGKMTLNRLPSNFFQSVEQSAFCPANFVSGIEPSEDLLLQGRLLSYTDTQNHRLGSSNFKQLPINSPIVPVRNFNQDGVLDSGSTNSSVNYFPSRIEPTLTQTRRARFAPMAVSGTYQQETIANEMNFRQAGELYNSFTESQQENLVNNLADALGQVEDDLTRNTMCAHFFKADRAYGTAIIAAANCETSSVIKIAASLDDE